jgi:hypothetical protein
MWNRLHCAQQAELVHISGDKTSAINWTHLNKFHLNTEIEF